MANIYTDPVKIIELKESVLEDNNKDAQDLRSELKAQKTCLLNLMSGPGSGKTTTLLALDKYLRGRLNWGVMEADIDSDVDARTILAAGIPAVQLHTGGMCHLDADMTRQGLKALFESTGEHLDLVVLENIGNLVCPAEFDTGAAIKMTILSVPEGDDKPAKYPLMYEEATSWWSIRSTRCLYSILTRRRQNALQNIAIPTSKYSISAQGPARAWKHLPMRS